MSFLRHSEKGSVVGIIVAIISVVLTLFLVFNRQAVSDQLSVWQFTPSSEIAGFVQKSGMNEQGEFYFYASHPSLQEAQAFNQLCGDTESDTAVLGCYDGQKIYIYNITDSRIYGIRVVTAAHEMLHAAYVRLGDGEKEAVNRLLEAEYQKLKSDPELAERLAGYEKTEPGQKLNELHSIIGTEIENLDPQLEAYYARYFADRGKTISLYKSYSAVFRELQKQADELSARLDVLIASINQKTTAYNEAVAQLNEDITAFNQRANSSGFSSQAEFNNERNTLVARSNALKQDRQEIENESSEYESVRQQLLTVAAQSKDLYESIDSSLAPEPNI